MKEQVQFNRKRLDDALSSVHHRWIYRSQERCLSPISDLIRTHLPHLREPEVQASISLGGIYLNGKRIDGDTSILAPVCVEYFEPRFPADDPERFFPQFSPSWIVYEDDDVVCAAKPSGLPSCQSRDQIRYHMKGYLDRYIGTPVHMPSRLDASTSGLAIASKSCRMHAPLQKIFERRLIQKTYLLEVDGIPSQQKFVVDAPIGRDARHPILRRIDHEHGSPATTTFEVLASQSEKGTARTLLKACPHTGRTHQIRVHVSACHGPVVGDNFYGGGRSANLRLSCVAYAFWHPFLNTRTEIQLPLCKADPWLRAWQPSLSEIPERRHPPLALSGYQAGSRLSLGS